MKRDIVPYNKKLKEYARELRENSTLSEILLWQQLRNKKMKGLDFDRQRPIDNYIVDFYCKKLKLAIEIDGDSHFGKDNLDVKRQHSLEKLGVKFLRFLDIDVKVNIELVLKKIEDWIKTHPNQESRYKS